MPALIDLKSGEKREPRQTIFASRKLIPKGIVIVVLRVSGPRHKQPIYGNYDQTGKRRDTGPTNR